MADSSQWKESLSLEETNKIRVSLGLKPIADPAASSSGPPAALEGEALAEDNYAKRRAEEQQAKEAKELKERIDKARNQKERVRKLGGRGLGDADEDEAKVKQEDGAAGDDAKAWVRRQKKRAKELAAKRAKEQEEEDRLAEEEERDRANKYGEKDLAGLKVAHGAEAFEEGEDTVLTLKDSRILDDEDDELHNVNLSEHAKTKHALDLKKKGKNAGQYTGLDDEEFEGGPGSSRGVLSKYDEDFDSIKVDGFRLGAAPSGASAKGKGRATDGDDAMNGSSEREKVKLSMDYTKTFNTDYLQEGEAGFKKPKKKKRRAMRTTTLGNEGDDAAPGDNMEVDGEAAAPRKIERVSLDETNLIDDDDLQLSLARQRREAAKQKIKALKSRTAAPPPPPPSNGDATVKKEEDDENAETTLSRHANANEDDDEDGDVLVLDDTSEFVRNISLAATAAAERAQKEAEKARRKEEEAAVKRERGGSQSVLPRVKAEEQDVPLSEMDAEAAPIHSGWGPAREDGEEDDQMYDFDAPAYGAEASREERQVSTEPKPPVKVEDDELATTAQEQLVSRGLASTLSLLRHQGLIKARTPEELAREKELKQREAWLAQQRRRQEERERERLESRKMGDKKDQQQREYENRMREQREAQSTLEAFANYKPAVNLTYHDKFGRDLTPKEAWKQLNYDFHGYGSGAKKTDKRLQKIENERKQMAMAAGDTPRSTAAAFAARAEKTGSATMILGVGNNNSAPIGDNTLGGVPRIEKNPKGKGKAVVAPHGRSGRSVTPSGSNGAQPVFADIPMRPLPLPSGSPREASGTPEPSRKAGFAPVRSFSPATAAAEEERRNGGESGPKLSIAVKRKALGEGEDSPASKRRA